MKSENIKWENPDTKGHTLYFSHMWNVQKGQIQSQRRKWLSQSHNHTLVIVRGSQEGGGKLPVCAKEYEVSGMIKIS